MLFTATLTLYIITPLYSLAFTLHLWVCLVSTVVVLSLAQFFPNPEEEPLDDECFGV